MDSDSHLGHGPDAERSPPARVEADTRLVRRRELIDQAHQLVADATSGNWSPEVVAADSRYLRIRADLDDKARAYYVKAQPDDFLEVPPEGGWDHWRLSDDIDDIDDISKRWRLT